VNQHIFGHERIEAQAIIDLMNDLYRNEWSSLHNFFYPQLKLKEKDRVGNKCKRKYDTAKTPYRRLIDSPDVSAENKQKLADKRAYRNPFKLQAELQKKLTKIHQLIAEAQFKKVS
jgi:hypothetical protein